MAGLGGTGRGGYGGSLGWSVGNPKWLNSPASKVNRYWRVIEEGSAATDWPWANQRIVGLWGNKAGPRGRLIEGDLSAFDGTRNDQKFVPFFRSRTDGPEGMNRAARAALYFFFDGGKNLEALKVDPRKGAGSGGGVDVNRARRRMYFYLMRVGKPEQTVRGRTLPAGPRFDQLPFVQGVIIREVQAGNYYARALLNWGPRRLLEMEAEAISTVMSRIFGSDNSAGAVDPRSPAGLRRGRDYQALDSYSRYGDVKPKTGRRRTEKRTHTGSSASAGFLASVNATALVQDFIRNSRGQITQYTSDLNAINASLAKRFQDEVVQMMQEERRRPVSGDLIRATQDARNRFPQG